MAGKAMVLKGSCHCQGVKFRVTSRTPHAMMACYCSICRKLQGGTGATINVQADAKTFQIDEGEQNVSIYRAVCKEENGKVDKADQLRHFCRMCGSYVWGWAPSTPEYIYPFASALDTDIPESPETFHIFLGHKASWVKVPEGTSEQQYKEMPPVEIEDWHKQKGLYRE